MWRRLSVLPTVIPLIGLTMMVDAVRAADAPDVQLLPSASVRLKSAWTD
jgi:hypothetical protein